MIAIAPSKGTKSELRRSLPPTRDRLTLYTQGPEAGFDRRSIVVGGTKGLEIRIDASVAATLGA